MKTKTLFFLSLVFIASTAKGEEEVGRRVDLRKTDDAVLNRSGEIDESPLVEDYRLPPVPEPTADKRLATVSTVTLTAVNITGVSVIPTAELLKITQLYVNRPVTLDDIQEMRLRLSGVYVDQGYINSGVVIPAQDLSDGVLEVQAIEGKLARIEISDDPKLADSYLSKRVARFVDEPLNVGSLQAGLRWLQTDTQIDRVVAKLTPGDKLGESVLQLAVEEPDRFEITLQADNHRAASVGSERGRLGVVARNLSGYGDVLNISGSLTDGSDDAFASLQIPLNRYNTRLQGYYSRSDSKIIEKEFEDLDIESETDTWGYNISHPLLDGLNVSLVASIGYEEKHSESYLAGFPFSFSPGAQDGEADTSTAYVGLDFTRRGNNSVLALRGTYRKGLDRGGATIFEPMTATEALSNPTGADGEFTVYLFQGLFIKRMNSIPGLHWLHDESQLIVRSTTQLSNDPLMSLEKMAIGGVNTVRGYAENLLVRDNGFAAGMEVQIPIPGYRSAPHPLSLIVSPFVDFGASWDEEDTDPTSSTRDTDETREIVGAGIGLIWQPWRGLRSEVYWGFDIADNFSGDDPRDSMTRERDLQDDGLHLLLSYTQSF